MSEYKLADLKGKSRSGDEPDAAHRSDHKVDASGRAKTANPLFEFFDRNLKSTYYRDLLHQPDSANKDGK